jgi:RND family efflux transporter MFP subunit
MAVALSACALAGCDRASATNPAAESAGRRVVVVHPVKQAIARTVTQPATVHALNEATIYAQVAGYLTTITVDKGDVVKKGQLLATIAIPELEAEYKEQLASRVQAQKELEAAKAELERVESTREASLAALEEARADQDLQNELYERKKSLHGDKVISDQELEIALGRKKEADAALALSQAKLKETEAAKHEAASRIDVAAARVDTISAQVERGAARVAYARIVSPLDAIVTHRFVDPGAMIQQASASLTQTSPIVRVAQVDRVRVDFRVPEANVAAVATGQRVFLRAEAYHGRTFTGTVTRFSGALDIETRTMLVEAEYDNKDRALMPGMFGEATLELERHEDALTLPAETLREHEGGRAVFVVENGTARRKLVKTGIDTGAIVEILSGIDASEAVVLGSRLTDGTAVVAVERKTAERVGAKSE